MADWRLKAQAYLYAVAEGASAWGLDESDRGLDPLLEKFSLEGISGAAREAAALARGYPMEGLGGRPAVGGAGSGGKIRVRHPLAGVEVLVEAPRKRLGEGLSEGLANAIGEAAGGAGSDGVEKRLFLALWRLLPDLLSAEDLVWRILPAGPDRPDHSIWDYATAASALAGTWDGTAFKPAVLIFSVASVQEFVCAARRTQDFWVGSFLFSYLVWRAMERIADELGPDAIVMPDLFGQPLVDRWLVHGVQIRHDVVTRSSADREKLKIANLPSMFTAIVPEGRVRELAGNANDALHKAKERLACSVKKFVEEAIEGERRAGRPVPSPKDTPGWEKAWNRQVRDFLGGHVFWAACPWLAERGTGSPGVTEDGSSHHEGKGGIGPTADADETRPGSYAEASGVAGRLLGARKSLRDFRQVVEPGYKCSQCGVREALSPPAERGDPYRVLADFWGALQRVGERVPYAEGPKRKLCGRVRKGDRLCSVCLTKRLAWEAFFLNPQESLVDGAVWDAFAAGGESLPGHLLFPSTSSIAAASFKERVLTQVKDGNAEKLRKALEDYVGKVVAVLNATNRNFPSAPLPRLERLAASLDDGAREVARAFVRLDGEWLYEESFDVRGFEHENDLRLEDSARKQLACAGESLKGLLREAAELGIPSPRRYYAVVSMDGDRLGELVTRGPSPVYHRALSGCLKSFALSVTRAVVEEVYGGRLVYAGGDDVLALVPLDGLLGALGTLRRCYAGVPGDVSLGDGPALSVNVVARCTSEGDQWFFLPGAHDPDQERRVTISAGTAIAHVREALGYVVEEALGALHEEAKGVGGRDAWAVRTLKRSGEPRRAVGKWFYARQGESGATGEFDVLQNLQAVEGLFRRGLSSGFLYQMRGEAEGMRGLPVEAMESELERLLRRREGLAEHDRSELVRMRIPSWLGYLARDERATDLPLGEGPWERVLEWLWLANFLASGESGG